MKKYLPALVAGFGAGVLHVVPVAKALTCCLVIPIAAVIAIILEQKSTNHTGEFELSRGAILGLLTGVIAALFGTFFDTLITFVTKNNEIIFAFNQISDAVGAIPIDAETKEEAMKLMEMVGDQIKNYGFSPLYTISILFNNLLVDSIFGLIGGLVGTKILNSRNGEN